MEDVRICKDCGVVQSVNLFVKAGVLNNKTYYRHVCSLCYAKRKAPLRERQRQAFFDYKSQFACEQCGNNDIRVLDFDHIDPSQKKFNVSAGIGLGYPLEKIIEEAKKCRVLCSNCHRIKTWEERIRKKKAV